MAIVSDVVVCSRDETLCVLTDEEYDILLRKITGSFDKPVNERTKTENSFLRKFYRWKNEGKDLFVGSSGKSIYVNGKRLMHSSERDTIIKKMHKTTKESGSRKV